VLLPALAVVAVAVIVLVAALLRPGGPGRGVDWAELLAPVARASGLADAVHLVMNVRSDAREDFDFVVPDGPMRRIEGWIRWPQGTGDRGAMRLDSEGRQYTFDGTTTTHFVRASNEAWRATGGRPKLELLWPAAWVQGLIDLPQEGGRVVAREERAGEGRLRIHWDAPALGDRAPGFFEDYEREVEVRWDRASQRLIGFQRWIWGDGKMRLFSETVSIEYLSGIDPILFAADLPANVRWIEMVPASPALSALAPREAAERFWNAAIAGDWEMVRIFCPSPAMVDWLREARPAELLRLGEPFESGSYPGVFIPYTVRYGGAAGAVRQGNLAMRKDNAYQRWVCDGGI